MTEREICDRQREEGNSMFYLIRVGLFYHAYDHGAYALSRLMGYSVVRKRRRWGEVLVAGFPAQRLQAFKQTVLKHAGKLKELDENTWSFHGVDGTPDPQMVKSPSAAAGPNAKMPLAESTKLESDGPAEGYSWLAEAVRNYNLSASTPLDAMLFLRQLQLELKNNLFITLSES